MKEHATCCSRNAKLSTQCSHGSISQKIVFENLVLFTHHLPTAQRHDKILRWMRLLAGISFALVSVSANAATSNDGAMEKGPVAVTAVIAIGIGIIGFGAYAIWLGAIEQTEKEKTKYRRDSMAAFGHVKPPIPIYKSAITVSIGVVITLGGIIFLAIVPSKVTKTPVAVVPATMSAVPNPADRSRGDASSSVPGRSNARPNTRAGANEKPATAPELTKSKSQSTSKPRDQTVNVPRQPRRQPMTPESSPPTKTPPVTPMTSVDSPKQLPRVTRYEIDIPLPPGAMIVTPDTPLSTGMRLGAAWARKWNYVTVNEMHEDGTVTVSWDGWRTKYRMVREDLAIDPKTISPAWGVERLWSDASGKFSVSATYVDSKGGYVLLRKSDGEEVSIAIAKLSSVDRDLILKFAKQKSLQDDGS